MEYNINAFKVFLMSVNSFFGRLDVSSYSVIHAPPLVLDHNRTLVRVNGSSSNPSDMSVSYFGRDFPFIVCGPHNLSRPGPRGVPINVAVPV